MKVLRLGVCSSLTPLLETSFVPSPLASFFTGHVLTVVGVKFITNFLTVVRKFENAAALHCKSGNFRQQIELYFT